ncbi:glycosyl transferase family 1 [Rasiella sp. SM2506]|uniref:glycosyl transferase family 1 n=1 Tax=Rasiella sp. SM2506 TaxID=3423914 RepID=UPI003D7B2C41
MKRVLVITYYWPPAGGPGVQRWLYFVKYFREFGIEPVVYIPKDAHYPLRDESFLAEIPSDIEMISQPINEPYKFAKWFSKKKTKQMSSGIIAKKNLSVLDKLLLYIRGNFFIPDARVGWVKPSVVFLKRYLAKNPVETIITSGPPHSLHLIGLQLKKEIGVSWLADFRDPWTTIHYHDSLQLTKRSRRKHKQLEAEILQTADVVTVTSPTTKKEFQAITKRPVRIVTNGFERKETITTYLDAKFSIAHIGSLLSERNPILLWEVLNELACKVEGFRDDLEIVLAGVVGEEILESISSFGLSQNLRNVGYVSHKEALQLQHNAQLLLLLEIDSPETCAIIPGKLFEYIRAERPIIAIGPEGSDIKAVLEESRSGKFYTSAEKQALKNSILQYYSEFKKDGVQGIVANISKYTRQYLSEKMAQILKQL